MDYDYRTAANNAYNELLAKKGDIPEELLSHPRFFERFTTLYSFISGYQPLPVEVSYDSLEKTVNLVFDQNGEFRKYSLGLEESWNRPFLCVRGRSGNLYTGTNERTGAELKNKYAFSESLDVYEGYQQVGHALFTEHTIGSYNREIPYEAPKLEIGYACSGGIPPISTDSMVYTYETVGLHGAPIGMACRGVQYNKKEQSRYDSKYYNERIELVGLNYEDPYRLENLGSAAVIIKDRASGKSWDFNNERYGSLEELYAAYAASYDAYFQTDSMGRKGR